MAGAEVQDLNVEYGRLTRMVAEMEKVRNFSATPAQRAKLAERIGQAMHRIAEIESAVPQVAANC